MIRRRFPLSLSIALALATAMTAVAALEARDSHIMKVGRKGEFTFSTQTYVGDLVLNPGTYRFQHRVEGEEHHINIDGLVRGRSARLPMGSSLGGQVGEVKCRLETLNSKSTRTAVFTSPEGKSFRVTRIEIAGENVAHVF